MEVFGEDVHIKKEISCKKEWIFTSRDMRLHHAWSEDIVKSEKILEDGKYLYFLLPPCRESYESKNTVYDLAQEDVVNRILIMAYESKEAAYNSGRQIISGRLGKVTELKINSYSVKKM